MKQLEVQIMGQSYLLGCPEGGEAKMLEAVERVDTAMCKIRDAGKVRARDRIAVLAALNLAFDIAEKSAISSAPSLAAPALESAPMTAALSGDWGNAQLHELISRLDTALNEDGQLL
jgi:cell division protein ZapA